MISPIANRPVAGPMSGTQPGPAQSEDEKLRQSAKQLEGLFVQQLFKVMRETVPQQEGIVSGGAGEEMFTSLMDQHLAAETPTQWEGGMAEALYRQLRGRLPAASSTVSPPVSESR
ncbi:rod-binding protein [Gemmatimonas sp. UBA7669]|uniref:rod-binding protein n=1 Tax=Gemmatimonas sp. UBA7669 TaxID=1946568 RepID=UPI0025C4FCED|nr:rod-binding protein [Gemmatimonas sp. UBA7669]